MWVLVCEEVDTQSYADAALLVVKLMWLWWVHADAGPTGKTILLNTHSSILTWKTRGQRTLAGYSSWGRKKSDTTERLHFHSLLKNQDAWFTLVSWVWPEGRVVCISGGSGSTGLGGGGDVSSFKGHFWKPTPSELGSLWNDLPKYPGDSEDIPKKGVPGDLNLQ